MAGRIRGPMSIDKCEPDWFDGGTMSQTRSYSCRPTGIDPKEKSCLVTMTFGYLVWKEIPFDQAAKVIETYVTAEHNASNRLVKKINKDHWFTSYCVELLGDAKPPTKEEWTQPIRTLRSARFANLGGNFPTARRQLLNAVKHYEAVHKKWIDYRNRLEIGADRAITGIEWTITFLSIYVGAGYGVSLAAQSTRLLGGALTVPVRAAAVKGASMAAGLAGYATAAKQVGLVREGVEKEVDVGQVVLDTSLAFFTSLVGGALSEKFLGLMTPRVAAAITFDKTIVEAAKRAGVLLPASYTLPQKLLAEFLGGAGTNIVAEAIKNAATKAKGQNITALELMKLVVQEISKETLATALKGYFAKKAR